MTKTFRWACCVVASVGALSCGTVATSEQNPAVLAGAPSAGDEAAGVLPVGSQLPAHEDSSGSAESTPRNVELNFLFVHGVQNCDDNRRRAETSLTDLETSITQAIPARVTAYEAAHPGVTLTLRTARANLYTAEPSGFHPSNSTDPLKMDDWKVGAPGCASTRQGDPCTAAFEWRYRLAREIERLFPEGTRNIIIIAHSSGARAAMEVASNTGPDGVGTQDWGVQDAIAGVVTVHGMMDALGSSKYNPAGPFSFKIMCQDTDLILKVFGGGCTPGNGWCEYAGDVSGTEAADWVAQHKRALMLTGSGNCSPSLFTNETDGTLNIDAQASPFAMGLKMTAAGGGQFRAAHGTQYGSFCHSDITGGSRHPGAVLAAQTHIIDWLFTSAPRVDAWGTVSPSSIAYQHSTSQFGVGASSCPLGESAGNLTVAGTCRHPGFFDGDDHVISSSEFSVTNGLTCNGGFHWTQNHDKNNKHAAVITWKTSSALSGGGVLSSLH